MCTTMWFIMFRYVINTAMVHLRFVSLCVRLFLGHIWVFYASYFVLKIWVWQERSHRQEDKEQMDRGDLVGDVVSVVQTWCVKRAWIQPSPYGQGRPLATAVAVAAVSSARASCIFGPTVASRAWTSSTMSVGGALDHWEWRRRSAGHGDAKEEATSVNLCSSGRERLPPMKIWGILQGPGIEMATGTNSLGFAIPNPCPRNKIWQLKNPWSITGLVLCPNPCPFGSRVPTGRPWYQ